MVWPILHDLFRNWQWTYVFLTDFLGDSDGDALVLGVFGPDWPDGFGIDIAINIKINLFR